MKIEKTGDKYGRRVIDDMGNHICSIEQMVNNTWSITDLDGKITSGHRFKNPTEALKHLKEHVA